MNFSFFIFQFSILFKKKLPIMAERKRKCNCLINEKFNQLLCIASENGNVEVVFFLLNNGANVNQATNDGITPLYIASFKGYMGIVSLLLNNGANVNQADNVGYTPLDIASQKGLVEIVSLLLNHGANVNQLDQHGIT